jgi:hypothetical protein
MDSSSSFTRRYIGGEYDYYDLFPSDFFSWSSSFKSSAMKLPGLVSLLLVWVVGIICAGEQWPLHNDGINSVVEWYVIVLE